MLVRQAEKEITMKRFNSCVIALLLAAAPVSVYALGKNEKGCLVGGAVGGLGGHFIGSGSTTNTVLGAAAGCAVGTVVAKNRSDKQRAASARERSKSRYAARDQRREPRRVNDRGVTRY
jgi:outer membrane lipoprotein SlyB